ncbi:MAG: hypothetical protein KDJ19_08740 [Hyphomicrobiaceae bacterium]|nr:hypothetical protein [Hyphomicrobiaceae bacterium]MCC0023165.1 hypothetical protein [Hyphomicrobiaceae bacterium]
MIRTLLFIIGGVVLGLIIHLIVVLALPLASEENNWTRISELDALNKPQVLEVPSSFSPNPFRLDPTFITAVCRLSLETGPGVVSGILPDTFWSVAVFDSTNRAVYGTTNRSGLGQSLQLGVFNPPQTRLLAQRELEITEGLLIVESNLDDIYVVVRLQMPLPELEKRYHDALAGLTCTNAPMRTTEVPVTPPGGMTENGAPIPFERIAR